mmetsp:Transcript_4436/g.17708  ORF Transcript_4436/g.17708 Transcript_4436/m.17708 type:complete len:269 (-) Transcript_4436:2894-3700(-)
MCRRPGEEIGVGGARRGFAPVRLCGRRRAAPAGVDSVGGGGDAAFETSRPARGAGRGRAGVRPARDADARVSARARREAPGDGDSRAAREGRVLGRGDEGGASRRRRPVPGVDGEAHDGYLVPLLCGVFVGQRECAAKTRVRDAQRADGRGRARHGGRRRATRHASRRRRRRTRRGRRVRVVFRNGVRVPASARHGRELRLRGSAHARVLAGGRAGRSAGVPHPAPARERRQLQLPQEPGERAYGSHEQRRSRAGAADRYEHRGDYVD